MSEEMDAAGADLPNFLRLYEELGVLPDQGVGRLTKRYRQRLRSLRPDLDGPPELDLGWLTRSYREAIAFERRHGRLPGASAQPAEPAPRRAHWPLPARRVRTSVPREREPTPWRWRWMLAGAALTLLLLAITQAR